MATPPGFYPYGSDRGVAAPTKATTVAPPSKTPAAKPAAAPSGMTPAQMLQQAVAEANAAIQPQVAGLQMQQQNQDATNSAYQSALTAFYAALAPSIGQIGGHVSDAYNSAANTIGNVAHGYTGVLGNAEQQNANDVNAALARAGQTQALGTADKYAGSGMLDAFNATHGGIDATTLASEGAAKAAAAYQQPAIWAAQGRDALETEIQKAVAGDQESEAKIMQIYATVPALQQSIMHSVQSYEVQLQSLKDTEQTLGLNQQRATVDANAKAANARIQIAKLNASIAATNAKLQSQALDRQQRAQLQASRIAAQTQLTKLKASLGIGSGSTKAPKDPSSKIQTEVTYLYGHRPVLSKDVLSGTTTYKPLSYSATYKSIWRAWAQPYVVKLSGAQRRTEATRLDGVLRSAMAQYGTVGNGWKP